MHGFLRVSVVSHGVAELAMKNPEEADAAAFEYLMFMGYHAPAYLPPNFDHICRMSRQDTCLSMQCPL